MHPDKEILLVMQPKKVVDGTSHQEEVHPGQAVKPGQLAKPGQVVKLGQADLAHSQVGQALTIRGLAQTVAPDKIIRRILGPDQNLVKVPLIL